MEILQLKYFYMSAKYESFAKTAQKYMVPATSVSASIKRLEKELGCALFDREANKITLNSNGRRLLKSVNLIFAELDEVTGELSANDRDMREIKMLVRAMRSKITDYIIEFKEQNPHISFKTVFDFAETDIENYDIIIDDKPEKYLGYEAFELHSTRLFLKASEKNPLTGKKLTLKNLSKEPFLSMGEHSSMHKILEKACNSAGFAPDIVVKCNDKECYKKCLTSGIGIGIGRDDKDEHLAGVGNLNVTDFNAAQTICGFYKKQNLYGNIKLFIMFLKSKSL